MALTSNTQTKTVEDAVVFEGPGRPQVQKVENRLAAFVSELGQMTREERIRASRYTMSRWEYWAYAARYPDEVPLINGELERIALTLE